MCIVTLLRENAVLTPLEGTGELFILLDTETPLADLLVCSHCHKPELRL